MKFMLLQNQMNKPTLKKLVDLDAIKNTLSDAFETTTKIKEKELQLRK